MRQLALDLPFDRVSETLVFSGVACRASDEGEGRLDPYRWLKIQAEESIDYPWSIGDRGRTSRRFAPERLIAFKVDVGPGSEPAHIGLCRYPQTVELDYRPMDDRKRFYTDGEFDFRKWYRHCRQHPQERIRSASDVETRTLKTGLSGWRWGSFCKTQYASDPACGGLPNFLRCHISLITLLDRIGKLPGLQLRVNDEGGYGPSNYSDDWQQAREENREPTYVDHAGKYDAGLLAAEVGEWNEMIASFRGSLQDALRGSGVEVVSPIASFSNFEQLEFKGANNPDLNQFLGGLGQMAEVIRNSAEQPT